MKQFPLLFIFHIFYSEFAKLIEVGCLLLNYIVYSSLTSGTQPTTSYYFVMPNILILHTGMCVHVISLAINGAKANPIWQNNTTEFQNLITCESQFILSQNCMNIETFLNQINKQWNCLKNAQLFDYYFYFVQLQEQKVILLIIAYFKNKSGIIQLYLLASLQWNTGRLEKMIILKELLH